MPQSIGLLEEDRLSLIPPNYWDKHEFCFHLHDQIVHMLRQYEASGIHNVVTKAFLESIRGREHEFDGVNILEWMKGRNLIEPYRHHILSHVVLALTADMLNFLYEALSLSSRKIVTMNLNKHLKI